MPDLQRYPLNICVFVEYRDINFLNLTSSQLQIQVRAVLTYMHGGSLEIMGTVPLSV